ncbi:hypothetical protein RG903_07715 [Thermithiobacillus tepidarius DSM 3134]|uniref:spermine/spermidine synthase domain-containing protein n=1 Tax=Thermithiobacillus tepidarius TaxID=929 RepID=UPI00040A2412|nr:hypothetical protein [Thermithiobacillus tepidarius]
MRIYPGTIIHRTQDEFGIIDVVQEARTRSLYFGAPPQQSSMLLRDPVQLVFAYTRAMMACLLFNDKPRSALLIGLGGGSLAKFLLHHFPDCRVDAVENRASVADLAHRFFHLPEDPRLRIHIGDGGEFVRAVSTAQDGYDFLLVDAYDAAGMVSSVSGLAFFDACRARLARHGILSINLWSGDRDGLDGTLQALQRSFDGFLLQLPVEAKGNVIALAGNRPFPVSYQKMAREPLKAMEARFGIEFSHFLSRLRPAELA